MQDSRVFRWIRYAAVIVLAGAIGILLGHYMTRYETRLLFSREYCGSYKGIDVYKCGELDSRNAVAYLRLLETVPDSLAEECSAIYLTGGSLDVPEMSGKSGRALGLTQGTVIFITTDSFYVDVLYHEMFHVYDSANGNLSDSEEFRQIYYAESSALETECLVEGSERAEFFAAAGAEYLLNPSVIKIIAPETYRYFNSILPEEENDGPGVTAW